VAHAGGLMKVMVVQGSAERAGAERVMLSLVRSLDQTAYPVTVAFVADGPFVDEVRSHGIDVLQLPSAGRLRDVHRIKPTVRHIREAARRIGADLLHANGEKMSVYTGWAARALRIPAVFWLHDAPRRSVSARLAQRAMTITPHAAVVTCASWMAEGFRKSYGLPVELIRNGVDFSDLPEAAAVRGGNRAAASRALKAQFGWPDDSVVASYCGRLQRWKGVDVLIRAAAKVAEANPAMRFLVVGGALYGWEAEYAASLPRLAAELGLDDRIVFTGHRDDALELLCGADIALQCSVTPEPCSLVTLEALALGTPLIATRSRGPEEVIQHGTNGLLVPPGDVEALSDAIAMLGSSPELRATLGSAGADAADRLSSQRLAREFEALYLRIQDRGRLAV
jgi:glycosyltransferase involved in cell wall biosynthesis